jgi:hypothetical protein
VSELDRATDPAVMLFSVSQRNDASGTPMRVPIALRITRLNSSGWLRR